MDDFLPLDALERSFRYWWLVVLWVIVGGGAAWLIHTQLPPVYEARVVFYSSLDFKLTGKLTPLEEDKAIGLVQTVILSSPVMLQVVDDAQAQGIRLDIDALRKRAYVSRLSYQWELRLRNTDPAVAQTLANLWADRTLAALKEDFNHAQQAEIIRYQINGINRCVFESFNREPLLPFCQFSTSDELKQAALDLNTQYLQEIAQSGGMSAALRFDLTERASRPIQPTILGANSMILAGGGIGFILAILSIYGDWPIKFLSFVQKGRRHGTT
jgi:hypothetical protein